MSADPPPTNPTSGSRFTPPDVEALQEQLPDYKILSLIGTGGMGAVYKALQPRLNRQVAIKVLPPELGAHRSSRERFQREAQALARLDHPGIVTCYDFRIAGANENGLSYLVMECVDGSTLGDRFENSQLTLEHFIQLLREVCSGLEYAHSRGIVHRDIAPSNILVDSAGNARLTDFGIAKFLDNEAGATGLTLTGTSLGTAAYAAPEQSTPQDEIPVDHRADIYSVGALLYRFLTGAPPRGVFNPVSQTQAGIGKDFDKILRKSLAANPADRYPEITRFAADLDAVRVQSDPDNQPFPAHKRRHFFAATLSLLSLIAVGAFYYQATREQDTTILSSPLPSGRLRALGTDETGKPIDLSAAADIDDFLAVDINRQGEWIALRRNGTTASNRSELHGQSNVISVSAGYGGLIALHADGTLTTYGKNIASNTPPDLGPVTLASASRQATVVLRSGEVLGWNPKGPLDPALFQVINQAKPRIQSIATSGINVIALTESGKVFSRSHRGSFAGPDQVGVFTAVACNQGDYQNRLDNGQFAGILENGSVVLWREDSVADASTPPEFKDLHATALRGTRTLFAARTSEGTWRTFVRQHQDLSMTDLAAAIEALGPTGDLAMAGQEETVLGGCLLWIDPTSSD